MAQLAQKGGKGRVGDAGPEISAVAADGFQGIENREQELGQIVGPTVGELLLGQFPDAFVGVESWGVGRKSLEMKSLGLSTELADELAAVRIATVPQHEDMTADLAQQLSQEVSGLLLSNVLRKELKVEIQSLAPGDTEIPEMTETRSRRSK
jgi:hypothetical protein